jgi:hypothetical protein
MVSQNLIPDLQKLEELWSWLKRIQASSRSSGQKPTLASDLQTLDIEMLKS